MAQIYTLTQQLQDKISLFTANKNYKYQIIFFKPKTLLTLILLLTIMSTIPKQKRFRGLHSYYDNKTQTYHVFTYDPETKATLTELLIRGKKVVIVTGVLKVQEQLKSDKNASTN